MSDVIAPEWIALDWGTSNLRGWAMQGATSIAQAQSNAGMGALDRLAFEPALVSLISDWQITPATPIIACGMVGARQGWVEAPYAAVPSAPLQKGFACPNTEGLNVHIIPGLKQTTPPDVMRGEETQIAGFLALNPGWDGVICLPGTHTKWAQISAGEVVSFQTFLTGEMFAFFSAASVLRHSVAPEGMDDPTFDAAVSDALSHPARLAAQLFTLRADDLLNAADATKARARLSGLLIGAELAASKPYWLGQSVAILGPDGPARLYAQALAAQGVPATITDAPRMTLAGLTAAYRMLKETP